ncbi:STAS domain-containing protein [Nocardiopsis sp. N85]|uniref:STAS domain-containing protein n=1 Tax=Nocardiopsis sp. N85 TaxID=3029400 RepID=UPI00237EF5C7|nr:STAS domain-containing protein [Nocardiopsis sp. N85]MDE3724386.1 STAS domain-containing protein [Nocardiopsis sp. N85]
MAAFTRRPPAVSETPPSVPRLRLNPISHRGAVLDGGWWPRSGDPVAELPGLVLAIDDRLGPVHLLELGVTGWYHRPDLLAVAGRAIRLSWSLEMPPDLVVAVGRNGTRTRLLVVPPGVTTFAAWSALDLAILSTNTEKAAENMDVAGMSPPSPRTAPETDWESEGGELYDEDRRAYPSRRVAVSREERAGRTLLRISGDIDLMTAPGYRTRLFEVLRDGGDRVVLDLSGVTFFSAAGLSLLAETRARAERAGVDLRLAAPSARVVRLLELTGTHGLPPLHPTVREALSR